MDKSWIKKPRNTLEYHQGLNGFLDFAFEHSSSEGTIICPCDKCGFRKWKTRPEVFDHLICKPFPETYTFWCDHGETLLGESVSGPPIIQESIVDEDVMPHTVIEDPMQNMLKDAFGFSRMETQNSGVFCNSGTKSYASTSDNRPTEGLVPYYGKLVDIIELSYHGQFVVTLFKCQWANTTNFRLMKKDVLGFTSISFSHLIHTGDREDDEPYIQASESQLVYYVEDKMDEGWYTPVHLKPRDLFDMGEGAIETTYESEPYQQQSDMHWSDDNIEAQLFRPGVLVEFD